MIQLPGKRGFRQEQSMHQLAARFIPQCRLGNQLDRNLAVIEIVFGEINHAGRTIPELAEHFILADPVDDRFRHETAPLQNIRPTRRNRARYTTTGKA
jgi:hypothetical protein